MDIRNKGNEIIEEQENSKLVTTQLTHMTLRLASTDSFEAYGK